MANIAGKRFSSANNLQNQKEQIKNIKFSISLDEEKIHFLLSNCKLFDPAYLDSLNVLPPSTSKDLDYAFKNASFAILSRPRSATKNAISQSPRFSLARFAEAIDFFNDFKGAQKEPWVKLLNFINILPSGMRVSDKILLKFAKCFEFDEEDSLVVDFYKLYFSENEIFSILECNFFKYLSNFSLKKVSIRNFYPEDDSFAAFFSFLQGNRTSLVHLEICNSNFRSCGEHEGVKIFFPNLENLVIQCCLSFHLLEIQVSKKLVSFIASDMKLEIKTEYLNGMQICSFSEHVFLISREQANNFVSFFQSNPQLETFVFTDSFKRFKNKKFNNALYSLPNLKKLNVPIGFPLENYLGSPKIEQLVLYAPSDSDSNWIHLGKFPMLSSLRIDYDAPFNRDFFSYLQLDRLEYLIIRKCNLWPFEKEFFHCISTLKRLKVLSVSIERMEGIVLGDSIECAFLHFKGMRRISADTFLEYSENLNNKFSSLLPWGANVKYLQISSGLKADNNVRYYGNLKNNFPKLEVLKNYSGFEIEPNGFVIDHKIKFPYPIDLQMSMV